MVRRHGLALLATLLLLGTAPILAGDATSAPADRLRAVDALLADGTLDAAESAVAPLVAALDADSAPQWRADVLLRLARLRRAQGRHADAEAPLRTASEIYASLDRAGELGDAWRELAGVHWTLGRQADASQTYEQAAAAFARAGRVHDQAGALRSSTYGTRHATPAARQAVRLEALSLLADIEDVEPSHRYSRGALLHDLGDAAFGDGRYAEADRAYRAAESLLDVDVENRRALSLLLTSRGRLERAHGYPDRALPFYERALALQQATGYDYGISQTLNALAVLHQLEGRYAEARELQEQVITRYAATAPPWRALIMRLNAAWAMLRAGDADAAVRALDAYYADGGATQVGSGARQPEVDILLAAGRLDAAMTVADAIVADAERQGVGGEVRAQAYLRRATVRQRLGQPAAALDDLARASAQWEAMRRTLTASDYVKRGFADVTARTFYPGYIRALVAAGEPLRALEAAELARGRAFADLVAQRQADAWRPTSVPAAATSNVRDVQRTLLTASAATDDLTQRGAPATMASVATDVAIDSLVHVTPLAADDLRTIADRERALVAVYWQDAQETVLWVLRPGGDVRLHRIAVAAATVARLVADASAAAAPLARRRPEASSVTHTGPAAAPRDVSARARLHALLVAPFAAELARYGRLVVVPHGALARLSFATLVDRRGRYLVERASVRYAPSLTVLARLDAEAPRRTVAGGRAVVIGEPRLPVSLGAEGLPALPGARAEAAAVARTLGRHGIASAILTASAASESALRAQAGGARIVHVAAHGVISDAHPLSSFLALAGSGEAGDDDGRLTAAEVHQLRLDADLVVLSGCRTADGPVTGDGISGLTRAFLAAGARSVVASFWDLPDATAQRVLPAFYRAWQRDDANDKAEALRQAQVRLIGQLRRGEIAVPTRLGPLTLAEHPALWGGLAVIGAP